MDSNNVFIIIIITVFAILDNHGIILMLLIIQ